MLSHGVPKALEYETLVVQFPDPLNVGSEVSLQLLLFAEIGCSILLLLGLLGRFASVTLFIAMMVAVFVHHFGDVWSMRELPLLYASVYATLTLTGPAGPRCVVQPPGVRKRGTKRSKAASSRARRTDVKQSRTHFP